MKEQEALQLYRHLVLARLSEEKIIKDYFADEMKTPVHLGIGGEAIPVGVLHCLPEDAKVTATYRNHTLYLARTQDTDGFFGEMFGRINGACQGKAGSMHLCAPDQGIVCTSAVVGTSIPVALGLAMGHALQGKNEFVVTFFGDGAVDEGAFWESVNFACLKKYPILFICEDNDLAIHTPKSDRQGYSSLTEIISKFDCYANDGDGSDVLDVVAKTRDIVEKMKAAPKPAFLRFKYFRYLEHVGPQEDFKFNYRQKPSSSELDAHDPLKKLEATLSSRQAEMAAIRSEMAKKIEDSVARARQAEFPGPELLYESVLV